MRLDHLPMPPELRVAVAQGGKMLHGMSVERAVLCVSALDGCMKRTRAAMSVEVQGLRFEFWD
jgi:hypothetical protein